MTIFFKILRRIIGLQLIIFFSYHFSMINALARHANRLVLHHVRWHRPTDSYIKVNVDGS